MKPPGLFAKINLAASFSLALLLTGCFDTKEEFTLNPDGSGKVVHQSTFQEIVSVNGDTNEMQKDLREEIRRVLKESEGVQAWRDVTYKREDHDRIFFRATAYFTNLSELKIYNQEALYFAWRAEPDGKMVLNLRTKTSKMDKGLAPNEVSVPTPISAGEQANELKDDRAQYRKVRLLMTEQVGSDTHKTLFHLPGKVSKNSNFQTDPSGALKLDFDGVSFIEALDKLLANDLWVLNNSDAFFKRSIDEDLSLNDDSLNEVLFGSNAPVQAVVTGPTAPLFDYAAEVAAAKLDFARTEKELDLKPAVFAPHAQGEPLKNLQVSGVQWVNEPDPKRNMRAFGKWHPGYTLALSAELSGSVLEDSVTSEVETAIADDGSSLLPTNESERQSRDQWLSNDRTVVLFEVALKLPGKAVSGLKEVSGHLRYKVSDGVKEVDLGFEELEEGAKGAALGAKIESIEEDILKDGGQEMELALDTPSGTIKSVSLIADGKKTVLDQHFSMGDDDVYIVTLTTERPIPAKGRLSVEMYDNVRTFEVPFKLQNISLLGGSAAGKTQ